MVDPARECPDPRREGMGVHGIHLHRLSCPRRRGSFLVICFRFLVDIFLVVSRVKLFHLAFSPLLVKVGVRGGGRSKEGAVQKPSGTAHAGLARL